MFKNYYPERCYIIAEIGGNFTTFEDARRLVDAAAACGLNAIKIQTYQADTIVTKNATFDLDNVGNIPQYELFKEYAIDEKLHREVFEYIDAQGLDWFSTPSHMLDVELLEALGVGAHKIGADDATNLPLLRHVAKKGKPVLLSSGMCTLEEVREALNAVLECGNDRIILFHTVSNYPTYPEQVNLLAMQTLMSEFPFADVGFSDHTVGTTACICAAAMGARVVEKHFTYDKNAKGPDHMLSADPKEMKQIVDTIREFEVMKGTPAKRPVGKEVTNREKNRKSIVLVKAVGKDEEITLAHIDIKRPGHGIAPKYFEQIIGKKSAKDLNEDDVLQWSDLQ